MKFALITPSVGQSLHYVCSLSYHLVLAQHLIDDPKYMQMYKDIRREMPGAFIIVDNGEAEGQQPAFEEVVRVAEEIEADEIVMPDVIKDGIATAARTTDMRYLNLVPPRKRFIVPQGRNLNEFMDCLNRIEKEMEFRTIGVPKHLINSPCKGRAVYLRELEMYGYADRNDIHLLGLNSVTELHDIVQEFPWLRGTDSGMPVAWAQNNARVLPPETGVRYSLQWDAPFALDLAVDNLQDVLRICRKEI